MRPYWIDPAKPPFPMAKYFPFQAATGIQTSNSMWESAEGCATPWTRQKAGTSLKAALDRASGCVNAPAATTAAEAIFASFSLRVASFSQSAASKVDAERRKKVSFMRSHDDTASRGGHAGACLSPAGGARPAAKAYQERANARDLNRKLEFLVVTRRE